MLCKYIDMITQISVQIVYSEKRLENAYIVISDCELHGDVRITVKKTVEVQLIYLFNCCMR